MEIDNPRRPLIESLTDWFVTHIPPFNLILALGDYIIKETDRLQSEKADLAQKQIKETARLLDLIDIVRPSTN